MQTVRELHDQAMEYAEKAIVCKIGGDIQSSKELFKKALDFEVEAANQLTINETAEPTRSILFRSAASLALNIEDFRYALRLASNGLAGYPPSEIQSELTDILEEIEFVRHLSLKGIKLNDTEFKMTIWGNSIKKGIAPANEINNRIETMSTIIDRTVDRLTKRRFNPNRKRTEIDKNNYGLFVKAMQPSSFGVIFQLGEPIEKQDLLFGQAVQPEEVITEVLECIELIQKAEFDDLQNKISDQQYYENFIGLTKQIAPDGNDINNVGFTILRNESEKYTRLNTTKKAIHENIKRITERKSLNTNQDSPQFKVFTGTLHYAKQNKTKDYGLVKLDIEQEEKPYDIYVPISLMKDVVKPYFDESVAVTVRFEKKDRKVLEHIEYA